MFTLFRYFSFPSLKGDDNPARNPPVTAGNSSLLAGDFDSVPPAGPVRPQSHSSAPQRYNKVGRVIESRRLQDAGSDYMHLAVQIDDCSDGCKAVVCLQSNCFEAPLARIGDRVRLTFRTNFKIDARVGPSYIEAFAIDWGDRIRRMENSVLGRQSKSA